MPRQHPTALAIINGSKFASFPRLPTELCLEIWKYALPGPRTVVTKFDSLHHAHSDCLEIDEPIPTPLLFACRDSRLCALQRYTTNRYQHAYMNWNMDTLKMPQRQWMFITRRSQLKAERCHWGAIVKHLEIDCEDGDISHAIRYLLKADGATPYLRTVTLGGDLKDARDCCSSCLNGLMALLGDRRKVDLLEFADECYQILLVISQNPSFLLVTAQNPSSGSLSHFTRWRDSFWVSGRRRQELSGVVLELVDTAGRETSEEFSEDATSEDAEDDGGVCSLIL